MLDVVYLVFSGLCCPQSFCRIRKQNQEARKCFFSMMFLQMFLLDDAKTDTGCHLWSCDEAKLRKKCD